MEAWRKKLSEWEAKATRERRRGQGSFWTPADLAGWMAEWIAQIDPATVLDPGAGCGHLLAPLSSAQLTAAEIDADLREVLSLRLPGAEITDDFWAIPDERRFEAIIANPPYVSHAQIPDKDAIHERLERTLGLRLPRTTNLAPLFYAQCWNLLAEGGRMIFLMPTEFMQTKAGVAFKRFLVAHDAARVIVDLSDGRLFGEDVVSTAALVLAEKRPARQPGITFQQHTGRAPFPAWSEFIAAGKFIATDDLRVERRWRSHQRTPSAEGKSQRLDELCVIKPGLVTGNNGFFLLSWGEAAEHGLEREVRYCLIRPHQLPTPYFHTPEQIEALKGTDQRRWLLEIGAEPSAAARAYLDRAEEEGVHLRPTQKAREPWWRQDVAPPWDFVIGNFRRRDYLLMAYTDEDQLVSPAPFAAIPNLVYLRAEHRELTEVLFAWLISASGQQALRGNERHAGNGLYTIRSGALKEVRVPLLQRSPQSWRGEIVAALRELKVASLSLSDDALSKAKADLDDVAALLS